jgi:hypothetical protein
MPEWARFRKYARRMRTLRERGSSNSLSLDVFAVLQFCAINEPLFPNLKSLELWDTVGEFIPFIPSFLSSRTTIIDVGFSEYTDLPIATIALMVTTLPTLCPNLQTIGLYSLPRDPIITTAVSELLLNTSWDALRHLRVDSPLTEEARKVLCNLPNLCGLTVVVDGSTLFPTMVLPNLIKMDVTYHRDLDWLGGFRGATLGKLDSVIFCPKSSSAQISDFLEEFESVGLTTSTTLSTFKFYTRRPWRPNYRTLLPFTQLRELEIEFSCDDDCSSTMDDDIITDIARAMPRLEILQLGESPCQTPAGATAKGLVALAHHCPNLTSLIIHFRVDSFNAPPLIAGTRHTETTTRRDCALTDIDVGQIPIPEESVLTAALTLVRIFPNLVSIDYTDENWGKVLDAIYLSGQIVDCSSKERPSPLPAM